MVLRNVEEKKEATVVEVEVTLELLNRKINYLISLLENRK